VRSGNRTFRKSWWHKIPSVGIWFSLICMNPLYHTFAKNQVASKIFLTRFLEGVIIVGKEDTLSALSELQLQEQYDTILEFLRATHPTLLLEEGYKPCVEIRPINRGAKRDYMLNRSLNLWDLSEESLVRLKKFLNRHNGKPTCIYYSVFTFDNQMEAVTTQGKKAKPGKITSESALSTDEIALDFDNIGYNDYLQIKERLEALGIFALWVFSGHGYQAHILLDKALSDKNILMRAVYKFRSKGFYCDDACIDPARVMRLPGTFNCKCIADDTYDELEPPKCEVVQNSATRYSLQDVLDKLDSLPTVSESDEKVYTINAKAPEKPKAASSKAPSRNKAAKSSSGRNPDMVEVNKVEYPYLSNYDVPDAVARMLAYTPHGFRNKSLGFLIRFFKSYFRLGKNASFDILSIWASTACEPALDPDEFQKDFSRLYNIGGLNYDSSLAKEFGIIDFQQMVELRKRDITIPHKFFQKLDDMDGKTVRLYLAVKLLEHIEEPVTQASLCKLLKISERALRPTLQDLCKTGYVYLSKGNSRQKIPNTYHSHRGYSSRDGFVTFSYNDIRAYIKELYEDGARGNGELKLYLFMRYKFAREDIFMSQDNLGKNIGCARSTVSEIVYRLQEKHFLKISKENKDSYFESCVYTLLR